MEDGKKSTSKSDHLLLLGRHMITGVIHDAMHPFFAVAGSGWTRLFHTMGGQASLPLLLLSSAVHLDLCRSGSFYFMANEITQEKKRKRKKERKKEKKVNAVHFLGQILRDLRNKLHSWSTKCASIGEKEIKVWAFCSVHGRFTYLLVRCYSFSVYKQTQMD